MSFPFTQALRYEVERKYLLVASQRLDEIWYEGSSSRAITEAGRVQWQR
jgi:hypothetical protein